MIGKRNNKSKITDEQVDLREALFNGREYGPIERVQLPTEAITTLHGINFDLDPPLFSPSPLTAGARASPRLFYNRTVSRWLTRHPTLARAEVRCTGRGMHVILWLDSPLAFHTDDERRRWSGIIQ